MYRIILGVLQMMDVQLWHMCQLSTGHCMDVSLVFGFHMNQTVWVYFALVHWGTRPFSGISL